MSRFPDIVSLSNEDMMEVNRVSRQVSDGAAIQWRDALKNFQFWLGCTYI